MQMQYVRSIDRLAYWWGRHIVVAVKDRSESRN